MIHFAIGLVIFLVVGAVALYQLTMSLNLGDDE